MEPPSRALVEEFLAEKRLAVVGVSRRRGDFTRRLCQELLRRGYDVLPVNPLAAEIEGRRCYRRVQEIEPPPGAALLLTRPAVTEQVVRDCAQAGVGRVWLYRAAGRGAVSPEAMAFCRAQGMQVVAGLCPWMFLPGAGWIHRLHAWLLKVGGGYPGQGGSSPSGSAADSGREREG